MFSLIKRFWLEALIIVGFIIFSFIYPVKIISAITGSLLAVWGIVTVTHDDRIQDPYSSILGLGIFAALGLFVHFYW